MRILLIVLALVLAATAALVAQWPAGHALPRLTAGAGLALDAIEGSVWAGTAQRAWYRGLALGRLRWTLSPASVLRLAPQAEVAVDGAELAARATITRPRGGGLVLTGLDGRLPAGWLQRILNEPFLGLAGVIGFEFDRVGIGADGRLLALEGRTHWEDARLSGRLASELGDLRVDWRTESAGVMLGSLADAGGPLELNGVVTVTADHYRIDARLRARSADSVALRQALELLGRADAAGWVRLQIEGPMLPL